MTVRFDDSLPLLVDLIVSELGEDALRAGTVLRDAIGCLAFFADVPLEEDAITRLSGLLRKKLGAYARPDRVIAGCDDYGVSTIRDDPTVLPVNVGERRVRLVDRRLVGVDWLQKPSPPAAPPPRFVFASLKGGVGRSTALAMVAAHLAARGRRVLAVDLDMEAPGLGPLLLTESTLPKFGLIDALVENGMSRLDTHFYADLVGPSSLAARGGRIDVIPALGRRSLQNPADVLAKLARAYMEDVRPDGAVVSIMDQVREIIDELAKPTNYDAVLVDARAGLHETTASAVLGLGAEVLLFGLDEPQTFQGYSIMFAHLARFVPPGAPLPEWAERLTMVQGKAPADASERMAFADRCRELFASANLGPSQGAELTEIPLPPEGSFSDVSWDDTLSDEDVLSSLSDRLDPVVVFHDGRFERFDPLERRDLLSEHLYRATFGDLLDRVDGIMASAEEQP